MEFGKILLTLYAVWGNGPFARFLRNTSVMLAVTFLQFMVCFWIWSFDPLLMTFLIPIAYIAYLWLTKTIRIAIGEAQEKKRIAAIRARQAARKLIP